MIDNFALGLSHGLMLLATILLLRRRDLDTEVPRARRRADNRGDKGAARTGWRQWRGRPGA